MPENQQRENDHNNDKSTIGSSERPGDEQSIARSSVSWLESIGGSVVDLLAGHTAEGIRTYAEIFDPEDRTKHTASGNELISRDERNSIISRATDKWVESNVGKDALAGVDDLRGSIFEIAPEIYQDMAIMKAGLNELFLQGYKEIPNDVKSSLIQGEHIDDNLGKRLASIVEMMQPAEALPIYEGLLRYSSCDQRPDRTSVMGLQSVRLLLDWNRKHPAELEQIIPADQ